MSVSSPTQVALSLADLSRQLDALRIALRDADDKAVRARHRYDVAFAKAFLSSQGSNADTRKQEAVLATEVAKLDAELADAVVRDLKRGIDVLRERIHVGQSYGAAVRSEWAAS